MYRLYNWIKNIFSQKGVNRIRQYCLGAFQSWRQWDGKSSIIEHANAYLFVFAFR